MNNNIGWFNEARFGMFVHWGVFSVPGRGEWIVNRENIPFDEYVEKYAKNFKAEKYDPVEWVALAKDVGMKYIILTTRHHDGFALWPTETTDFNAGKIGPKRDLLKPFVDAARVGGLKVGFYYSVADWYHPDYPDAYARDWPTEWKDEQSRLRFTEYYYTQLKELMSNYGKIDILWYDGCFPKPTEGGMINKIVKELQPGIILNDRNGSPWDFKTSEQAITPPENPSTVWEACLTLNSNWGYHKGDDDYKTPKQVVDAIVETAANAGNLLLNVGPRSDGQIPSKSVDILKDVGNWLRLNGEFLSNSARTPFSWNNFGRLTTKGNKIYIHIFRSTGSELCLAEIKNKVLSAYYLENKKPVCFSQQGNRLFLKNLANYPNPIATTIALEIEGKPEPVRKQTTFWIPG